MAASQSQGPRASRRAAVTVNGDGLLPAAGSKHWKRFFPFKGPPPAVAVALSHTMAALFCLFGLTDSVSHNFTPSSASPCSVTRGGPFTHVQLAPGERRAGDGD